MTELSVGVNIDGKETLIPTIVPTLTQQEINHLKNGGQPTKAIVDKAVAHARQRMAQGQSPFAGDATQPRPVAPRPQTPTTKLERDLTRRVGQRPVIDIGNPLTAIQDVAGQTQTGRRFGESPLDVAMRQYGLGYDLAQRKEYADAMRQKFPNMADEDLAALLMQTMESKPGGQFVAP